MALFFSLIKFTLFLSHKPDRFDFPSWRRVILMPADDTGVKNLWRISKGLYIVTEEN